jgi:hypothetical protein
MALASIEAATEGSAAFLHIVLTLGILLFASLGLGIHICLNP